MRASAMVTVQSLFSLSGRGLAGLERMYKHLICLVVLKSCEAEQSTKEERAWKQSETLTNGHLGPLFIHPFIHSVQENTKIK